MQTPLRACGANVVKAKCTLIENFHTFVTPFVVVRVDFGTEIGVKLLPVTGSSAGGKLTPSNKQLAYGRDLTMAHGLLSAKSKKQPQLD